MLYKNGRNVKFMLCAKISSGPTKMDFCPPNEKQRLPLTPIKITERIGLPLGNLVQVKVYGQVFFIRPVASSVSKLN